MLGGSGVSGDVAGGSGSLDTFLGMVALLSDPTKLQAEYAKISEARAAAQVVVDAVAPANEIVALRDKTREDRAAAAKALDDARAQADEIVSKGKEEAAANIQKSNEIINAARVTADQMKADADAAVAASKTAEAKAEAAVKKLASAQKAIADKEAALADRAQQLVDSEKALAARSAAYEALVAQFSGLVGKTKDL